MRHGFLIELGRWGLCRSIDRDIVRATLSPRRLALPATFLAMLVGMVAAPSSAAAGLSDCRFEVSPPRLVCDDTAGPTPTPSPLPTESPTPGLTPTPTPTPAESTEEDADPAAEGQPNIIVFMTDDQRFDTIGLMPRVQEMQATGVTFTNAFVTTPLCCPSRATFFTGQYAHNHGVWRNGGPNGGMDQFDDTSTLATSLQAAGYTTALIGKYLNGYKELLNAGDPYIPPGWDFWVGQSRANQYNYKLNVNGIIEEHGTAAEDYAPWVLAQHAADFLAAVEEPFFLLFSITVPHFPFHPPPDSTCSWTNDFEKADCSLEAADQALDEILTAMGDRLDNTMVIYTSDNGFIRNEHGRESGKNCPYDECLRVPLIIRYPPGVAAPGSDDGAFVLNIDLAPTILDLAGGSLVGMNGKSLLPLLSDELARVRKDLLFELGLADEGLQITDGVRNWRWKLIVNADGSEELYNMRRDPSELNNVVGRPRHADLLTQLRDRLAVLRQE